MNQQPPQQTWHPGFFERVARAVLIFVASVTADVVAIVMLLMICLPLMLAGSILSAPFRRIKRPRPRARLR